MESTIERRSTKRNQGSNIMLDFEFICRSTIGILGTTLTVMLESVSVIIQIAAGLATVYYMISKAVELKKQGARKEIIFQQNQDDRQESKES